MPPHIQSPQDDCWCLAEWYRFTEHHDRHPNRFFNQGSELPHQPPGPCPPPRPLPTSQCLTMGLGALPHDTLFGPSQKTPRSCFLALNFRLSTPRFTCRTQNASRKKYTLTPQSVVPRPFESLLLPLNAMFPHSGGRCRFGEFRTSNLSSPISTSVLRPASP